MLIALAVLIALSAPVALTLAIIALVRLNRAGRKDEEIASLRRQVDELSSSLAALTSPTSSPESGPGPSGVHAAIGGAPIEGARIVHPPIEASAPAESAPGGHHPPPSPVPPMPSPTRSSGGRDLETQIGLRWLNWIGVVAILFGTAFFLRYDLSRTWIGGGGQLSVGFLVGVLFVVAGYRAHAGKDVIFSFGLTAGGISLLYLSVYAAYAFYHLIPGLPALVFTLGVTAAGAFLAIRENSRAIAVLTTLGGFLTPVLLASGQSNLTTLLTAALVLDLGVLALSWHRSWRILDLLAFLGTQAYLIYWLDERDSAAGLAAGLAWLIAFFLVFLVLPASHRLVRRIREPVPIGILLVLNSALHYWAVYRILDPLHAWFRGPYALLLALPHLGMAGLLLRRLPEERSLTLVFWDIAVALVAIAIPVQLDLGWVTFAWSLLGFLLIASGLATGSRNTRIFGLVLQGLALFRILTIDTVAFREVALPVVNRDFLTHWGAVLLVFISAVLYRRYRPRLSVGERPVFTVLLLSAVVALWWAGSNEIHDAYATRARAAEAALHQAKPEAFLGTLPPRSDQDAVPPPIVSPQDLEPVLRSRANIRLASQLTLSLFWAFYAAALILFGFRTRYRPIRILAFVLIGLTIGKVFLVDLGALERAYRVAAFIVLGLLLLGLSLVYQRQRRRAEETAR